MGIKSVGFEPVDLYRVPAYGQPGIPFLIGNTDPATTIFYAEDLTINTLSSQIPPLGFIGFDGEHDVWASTLAQGTSVLADFVPGGTHWAANPAITAQLNAAGLAKDSTLATINTQLITGVPPAVTNTQSGQQILQPPSGSPFTLLTMSGNGRIWAANVSYAMGSSGGTGSNQGYARIMTSGGKTLAVVECCVVGNPSADSNTDSQTFPGLAIPSGASLELDVNNGTTITGVVQRGSGLVVVSIP